MQLSPNFHLSELIQSQSATRAKINNQPNAQQIQNLKALCCNILQPIRDHYQKPVIVSSGYRSVALNARIGGSHTSQHCFGQAADFEIPGLTNKEVAEFLRKNLDFDQLILEFYDSKDPRSGWIHCSYIGSKNHKQSLIYAGRQYQSWA
jgi:zinc D-Ala-D-Ala carboxypeptidase